ncbi:hypothetical protein EVA_06870 [gut metagenome]|uniref:Uncharacterized protein n=2 Tax=gut metagenome TaxID=749906 RepID=J9GR83_9ZZZZ
MNAFQLHFFSNQFRLSMGKLRKLYLLRTLFLVSLHFIDKHLPVIEEFLAATMFLINQFSRFQDFSGTAVIPLEDNGWNFILETVSQ